jgi:branched-chain amino acid transport system permease protein
MVILGGAGRLWGGILGALVFVMLETWLAQQMQHWKLVFGPMLVLAVLFLRGGLAGLVARRG